MDKTRSLGLDVGDKRTGVALSDPGGILASPFTIIDCEDDMAGIDAIIDIVERQEVGQIIVGLPISMDGSLSEQAEKVKAFTRKLSGHTEVPVEFRDERLTTVEARRLMHEVKRARKKVRDDAVAAALILQRYLDEGHEPNL